MQPSDTLVRTCSNLHCNHHKVVCLYQVDTMALRVERVVCGSLMTSLEMAGVSLSLLKMESGWEQYIGTYI